MPTPAPLRLFLSYARADDEPFVKRLYKDLKRLGFDIWWDREAMESRGDTFLNEIKIGIFSLPRISAIL